MKTTQQAPECSGCGEVPLELLTEEDAGMLQDIAGVIIKGQERMATQAERDNVNSMVQNCAQEK